MEDIKNDTKSWNDNDTKTLQSLINQRMKIKEIAKLMHRKTEAIYRKIYLLKIDTKILKIPTDDEKKEITIIAKKEFNEYGQVRNETLHELSIKTKLHKQHLINYIKTLPFTPNNWPKIGRPPNVPKHETIMELIKKGYNLKTIAFLIEEESKFVAEIAKRNEKHYDNFLQRKNIKNDKNRKNILNLKRIEDKIFKLYEKIKDD